MNSSFERAAAAADPETALAVAANVTAAADLDKYAEVDARPAVAAPAIERVVRGPWRGAARLQTCITAASLAVVGALVVCALFPEAIAPYPAGEMQASSILVPPFSVPHPLGTDQFGRDVLSLIVFGARRSLLVALLSAAASMATGVFVGLTAGYAGGLLDTIAMRLVDVWMAVPAVLLSIAVCAALGPSLPTLILSVSAALAPRYARLLRGHALSLRTRGFVEAARVSGSSHTAVVVKHVLPHCTGPILVLGTIGTGWAILIGSALSFLGFGVEGDRPDWAYLIAQGRSYLAMAWWTVTFPGLAISAFVVATNLLGDSLRRSLDPRGAGR